MARSAGAGRPPKSGYSVVGFTALEWGEHTMRGKNGEGLFHGPLSGIREERGVFLKLTEKEGLWKKIRSHVGTTVEHPVSPATRNIRARIADEGVKQSVSVCPYCAVGCSTLVYHRDGRIIDIEGNPDSPINAGTLCPKGSATFGMHVSPYRWTKVRYRRPYSSEWEDLTLDQALDMIAERVKKARDENWQERDERGKKLSRSMAVASIGGGPVVNEAE